MPLRRTGAAVAVLVLLIWSCGSTSYVFPARRFDPVRGCVDPFSTIYRFDGTTPGAACPVVCLLAPSDDGGAPTIYVTSECDPYPPSFDTSGTSPDCPRATAAFTNGPSCTNLEAGVLDGAGPALDATADAPTPRDAASDASDTGAPSDASPEDAAGDAAPRDAGRDG